MRFKKDFKGAVSLELSTENGKCSTARLQEEVCSEQREHRVSKDAEE